MDRGPRAQWESVPAGPALGGAAVVVAVAATLLAAYVAGPFGSPFPDSSWERNAWLCAAGMGAASLPAIFGYVGGFSTLGGGDRFDAGGRAREALRALSQEAALEGGELTLPEGSEEPGALRGGVSPPAWRAPATWILACGLRALSLVEPTVRAGTAAAMAFLVMMLGLILNSMVGGQGPAIHVFVGVCMLTVFAGFASLVLAVLIHLAALVTRFVLKVALRS